MLSKVLSFEVRISAEMIKASTNIVSSWHELCQRPVHCSDVDLNVCVCVLCVCLLAAAVACVPSRVTGCGMA